MLKTKDVRRQMLVQQGRCPECSGTEFVTDMETGEIACSQCGLVLQEEILDQKPEWRAFTPEETRSKARTGPPASLRQFDKGLSTTFQPYKDTYGRSLPMRERLKMMRLRKWNIRARVHSSAERNLSQAMNELTRLSDKLHIPASVEENAALIYRKALDEGLIRGRSIKSIAAAALYAACRLTRTPRSLKEIAEASTRRRKEISRCYRLLQRELEIKMPVDDPVKYISKIASHVRLSQKTQNTASKLLERAKDKKGVVGKGPTGMAAAALYIAAIMNDQSLTQRELAKAADVTEVTVRNRYKELDKILGLKLRSKKNN
ncbi:MAG: transcription initiation factor IIB [Candidatus Bathyarchaeota archaeon]|nr:transcription initiation factor IIB [Candidatus Bathyarchaeota archaeon]